LVSAAGAEEERRTVFGKPLRQARRSAGWTKKYLARRLGISKAEVSALEKGLQPATVDLLKRFDRLNDLDPHLRAAMTEV
jgi:transcriptional regulator with XRE-family HTH domain